MHFNDILEKKKEINFVQEAYTGQFTIGFELEGICTWKQDTDDELFHLPSYGGYTEENQPKGGARLLKEKLDEMFGIEGSSGESKIEKDSSLNTVGFSYENGFNDSWNFEYATNKIPFNAKNIEKIYQSLGRLNEEGIYTNDSCGFHIHISFPDIDKKEVAWILCCLAIDEDLLQDLLKLDSDYGTIFLFSSRKNPNGEEIGGYAKYHYLLDIGNAIKENDYEKVDELLNNEKYNVFHIHSENGTIEWRGPRGFLNHDDDKVIKSFILKWFKLISKIAKMTQSTTYTANETTIDKKELLSHLSLRYFNLDSPVEKAKKAKQKNLFDTIEETPVKLFSMTANGIKKLREYDSYKLVKIIYNLAVDDMFGEDWALLKKEVFSEIFKSYSYYYYVNKEEIVTLAELLWYPLKSNGTSLLEKLDDECKNDLLSICSDILLDSKSTNSLSEEFYELCEDLNIFNSEIFKKELEKKLKSNYVINFSEILSLSTNLPAWLWNILLSNKYVHYVSLMEEVPEKYQLRMIQKDPFNIQYISNPTEKVIKTAEQKNPNIKDYIRGE